MKVFGNVNGCARALVLDIDNTIYVRTDEYFAAGSELEMQEVCRILGHPVDEMEKIVETRRAEIAEREGRKAVLTETLYSLGITSEQWSDIRLYAWRPEEWVTKDREMCSALARLSNRYLVAFGTNNGIEIGRRTLQAIGFTEPEYDLHLFGPENLGVSKPEVAFFSRIACLLDTLPHKCVSIGDREVSDGPPAIEAGYGGAIIVHGSRDETLEVINRLLSGKQI
jgi:FMN phosphatase YigB (HAD superfamily)